MLHGRSRRVWLGAAIAVIALIATVTGCGSDGGGEDKCEGFAPVRLRITEELFEPDGEPYFVWVWNERRTCGYSYMLRPGIGTAGGGICVIELNEQSEFPPDWPIGDRLIISPTVVGGTCSDLGRRWHTGVEPPINMPVIN